MKKIFFAIIILISFNFTQGQETIKIDMNIFPKPEKGFQQFSLKMMWCFNAPASKPSRMAFRSTSPKNSPRIAVGIKFPSIAPNKSGNSSNQRSTTPRQ